jgi:signal transduction histidine kinase
MARRGHSLLAALVATTVVVTAALGWAASRLLDQQRAIDDQRAREQVESGADAITAQIRGTLAEAGERLSSWVSSSTVEAPAIRGAVVVAIDADGVRVAPDGGLPFVPTVRETPPRSDGFAAIEAMEFSSGSLSAAADRYRALTKDPDPAIRAGALIRLGRVLRKARDYAGALDAYARLRAMGGVRADGLPAELAGLEGERATHISIGDRERERQVAARLAQGLDTGRWLLTRGPAELYRGEVATTEAPEAWRLASAMSEVWAATSGAPAGRGQRVIANDGRAVLVLWRSNADRTALLAAFPNNLMAASAPGVAWRLADPDGRTIAGDVTMPARSVARILGSEYPWTLHAWSASPARAGAGSTQRLLVALTAAVLVFVWGASYFMGRAIRREAAVARLQSEFVAAVSHEFRTPLTAVRQMAEMLAMDRLPTEERRHRYYDVIAAEAARLQRLVETLLNFGRMEAGAERYRFAEVDAAALVRGVVQDLELQARDAGARIELDGPDDTVRVRADEGALAMALRNLIDNAIKYSPGSPAVHVRWTTEDDRAAISVIDRGLGIPRSEQQAIFRKFVRGRAAAEARIKGTGVGLSMVQRIVQAHGGEIRLDSEVGRGSTFTLLLPGAQ